MTTVKQVLADKGSDVTTVGPADTVHTAIRKMAESNIGSVVVTEGGKVAGIVTERLYSRNVELKGRTAQETPVRDIMETRVIYARPEQTTEECLAVMIDRKLRHLPVMEGARLLGMISIGDLGRSMVGEQKFTIDQLVHYIQG